MAPYATFEKTAFFPAFFSKVTFLLLLAVLMAFFCIITMSPVAGVMAKLDPVTQKLLCLGQKVDRSVEQLKKKIDGVIMSAYNFFLPYH